MNDFNRQLVYGGAERDIKAVMIGGRVVFAGGRITTVDEQAVRRWAADLIDDDNPPDARAAKLREDVGRLWHEIEARLLPIRSYIGRLP